MRANAHGMDDAPARTSRTRIVVAALSGTVALALGGLWSQRTAIASHFVDRELARRGVRARYDITRFGIVGQRLEHVVIGDPARPDLTAEWADLKIVVGLDGPELRQVAAGGVRVRGTLADGRVSLGAIDRLLPASGGGGVSLPDLDVALSDARMALATPGGGVTVRVDGRGRLADGFVGRVGAAVPDYVAGGCTIRGGRADMAIAIRRRSPQLRGPVTMAALACRDGTRVTDGAAQVDATIGAALDRWQGMAAVRLARAGRGGLEVGASSGRIGFAGDARGTAGDATLAIGGIAAGGARAQRARFVGSYATGPMLRVRGDVMVAGAAAGASDVAGIRARGAVAAGTPIAPVVQQVADATAQAARRFDAAATVDYDGTSIALSRVVARSASGASLRGGAAAALTIVPAGGATRIAGRWRIAGGGLPAVDATLVQARPGGAMSGVVRIADITAGAAGGAGDASLRMTPIIFSNDAGGTRIATTATIDGPVAGGQVTGLTLPVVARTTSGGGFVVNPTCVPLRFTALSLSGLTVGPTGTILCPAAGGLVSRGRGGRIGGGGAVADPVLVGTLGGPVTIAARQLAFDLGRPGVVADALAVRLGPADAQTRLDIERLTGTIADGGVAGRFAGLSGRIGNVPLLLSDGEGSWRLVAGRLALSGDTLTVADSDPAPRFKPLVSRDVVLTLADGVIDAHGVLHEPQTATAITTVTLRHDLSHGVGHAVLDVPGIAFTKALQPEQLTRLTLGVVADARGTVAGHGRIDWDRRGVTSGGQFSTKAMDFAAAFGPVTGLAGTVTFDDLLALHTPPGQVATIQAINPGIAVADGVVRYQLLPDQRVRIESGRWPFSGGTLALEPTLLDFSGREERRMTFRVTGMDAASFVEQFDFKNIAVTGTFDGVLPIVYDARGGRIVGGRLAVRRAGGTLAYVGEVSNAQLGMFGRLAFDALKAMRYDSLAIELDGALDGELVSRVLFDGTNQTPKAAIKRNGLLSAFSNLPFRFNITIRAPFRGLLNSAQSLNDPRGLIRQSMPAAVPVPPPLGAPTAAPAPTPSVQPSDSKDKR